MLTQSKTAPPDPMGRLTGLDLTLRTGRGGRLAQAPYGGMLGAISMAPPAVATQVLTEPLGPLTGFGITGPKKH